MIPEKYRYDIMARTVSEVDSTPLTDREVAVLLEALGFFKKDDGERSQFLKLSEHVQRLVPLYSAGQTKETRVGRRTLKGNLRIFTSGIAYGALWSLMLTVLFAGGISLWATYPERLGSASSQLAFSVGLGVLISFIATGGAQQVFSHRINYYRIQENLPLTEREAIRGYGIGFLSIAIAAVAFLFLNALTAIFTLELAILTVVFLGLLGGYLILVIPLYANRKFHLVAAGLLIALTCLYSAFYVLNLNGSASADHNVLISQLVGLVALNAVTAIECISVLRPKERRVNPTDLTFNNSPPPLRNVRPPRLTVVLFGMVPLFVFGTMFYLLLFFDRLVGWTATGMPFLLTYNTASQFGADIALLVLIPLTGITYYFSNGFYELLEAEASAANMKDRTRLKKGMMRFVTRLFASIGLVACVSVVVLWQYAPMLLGTSVGDQESVLVFRFSLIAYSLLALFLANTFVSLSFRRSLVPAVLLVVAALTDVGVNMLFPGFVVGWHPVYGLLAGLILATGIASVNTMRFLRRAHYFYYSAF